MSVNLRPYLKTISEIVSDSSVIEYVQMIWENDRYFSYPKFQATARNISDTFREEGVIAETFELPADGQTVLGDWKMPLGWECRKAHLEIYDPFEERGRVLGDTKKTPCHVIMWSGSTPKKGLTAELIRVEDGKELEEKKKLVRDKIVYTPNDPRAFKKKLVEYGALAVVSSFCRNARHLPDTVNWFNGWSDRPGGWAFQAEDSPLPGMGITPNSGIELDVLLERGKVSLRMIVDSRYLPKATLPISSGRIDAELPEEILAIGHVMEQGANDNASGAAVIMESLCAIQRGTSSGKLPPLKRGVRGLLVNECYGTIGFAAQNPDILKRIIAAVNWDTVGRHQESADAAFRHHRCPDACASVVDTLILLLLETWLPVKVPFAVVKHYGPFALTDNCYNDPKLDVPCTYFDSQDRFWHTSSDTMKDIDANTLHTIATISTAFLHFLATATKTEATWLAHQTVRRYGKQIEDVASEYAIKLDDPETARAALLAQAFDHLAYLETISHKAVLSAERFMLAEEREQGRIELEKLNAHTSARIELEKTHLKNIAGVAPAVLPAPENFEGLEDIVHLRPYKNFIGTPAYDSIPREEQAGIPSPVWNTSLHAALFWSMGELPFGEIIRRVGYEYGKTNPQGIAAHFRFMAKHNLIQFLQEGEPIPTEPEPEASAAKSQDSAE